MDTPDNTPAVYVGTYAKYNQGSIAGAWVQLTEGMTSEEFAEACQALHQDEVDPEFMFQDFENFPREYYGESGLSEELWAWLELDDDDREKLAAFIDCFGPGNSIEDMENAYQGKHDSDTDFADEYIESTGMLRDVPESLKMYFDTERFARDLMMDFSSSNGLYFSSSW